MHSSTAELEEEVFYPETDGLPMAENTLQYEWITIIKQGLEAVFLQRDDVFIAGDLFWYPVKGNNRIRTAPDVLVALGRPIGHRRSYLQWNEGDVAPQVVFEVLSPGNTYSEMRDKLGFYERYGVLEYYLYDPDHKTFSGFVRQDASGSFVSLSATELLNWTSPLLKVSFHWKTKKELEIRDQEGERFLHYRELVELKSQASELRKKASALENKASALENKANALENKANALENKSEVLAQKLRELGINPDDLLK
jgi:Uma2 family endonuclease